MTMRAAVAVIAGVWLVGYGFMRDVPSYRLLAYQGGHAMVVRSGLSGDDCLAKLTRALRTPIDGAECQRDVW